MTTKNTGSEAIDTLAPHEDLRRAIEKTALVRASDGATIIASENTGARGPWIFDLRALMLQPAWLDRYAEIFWEKYGHRLPFQVGGVETAGIGLVAAIVMKGVQRGTPVNGFYIRKSRKRQGLMKYIEGTLTDEPIIFVDDLINSGQTIAKQMRILSEKNRTVSDVFVLLAFRSDDSYSFLPETSTRLCHLFTLPDFGIPLLLAERAGESVSFETLWHYTAPTPSFHLVLQKSAPVLDSERVFFGCDDGTFRALDKKTGALVWEYRIGKHPVGKSILSSPIIHDGRVYFGAYDGVVYALDTATGKKIWEYDDADWIGSSPALAPEHNLLYIGLEFGLLRKQGGIVALDMGTGHLRWRALHPNFTHGSPLYVPEESLVVIGSNNGTLYAYDAVSGAIRWTFMARGDLKTRAAYDPAHRAFIFGSMDGTLYAVSARDGVPLHARETGAGIYSIPLVHGDTVYATSLDKCVYAIDTRTWKDRWVFETSGRIFASPVIHEDSLWVGSNDGKLYELDPENGALSSTFQTTERIVNAIAYDPASKHLFVPTVANEIYCIKK